VAGQIDLLFDVPGDAVTSDRRLAQAPDIPTFAEMGLLALSYSSWVGLFAPKGTPRDIIGKLNAAVVEALGEARRTRVEVSAG
jgi:tripartite-type tricarboxylate transporter receptor subunit TctC